MAHRTRIRANFAAWADNSAVLRTEFEALDAAQFSSIDGDAGGLWAPAAPVVIAGAGLVTVGPGGGYGASDFSASMQAQNWPERASVAISGSTLNSDVPVDFAPRTATTGPRYCAIPANGHPYVSEDGAAWTDRGAGVAFGPASPGGTAPCGGLAIGPVNGTQGGLMGCSSGGTSVVTSTDFGVTWAIGLDNTTPINAVPCYAASLGMWVLAGDSGALKTSATGTGTWTTRTTPAGWIAGCGGVKRVVWNGSLFVVLPKGVYNKVLTSPDGVTWTEQTIGASNTWTGLAWSSYDAIWMILGGNGITYRSADGITWSVGQPTSVAFTFFTALAVNKSLWIASTNSTTGTFWSVDKGLTFQGVNVGSHLTTLQGYQRVIAADSRFMLLRSSVTAVEFVMSLRSN